MGTSIFLSYPKPFNDNQRKFIKKVKKYLIKRGYEPKTLGVSEYDMDSPLKAIRRLMLESNGLISVAFRRAYISKGKGKPKTEDSYSLNKYWLTSPYSHIEPAMAFQIGLPILILREEGVLDEGILETGILGTYMPVFNLDQKNNKYLKSQEWIHLIKKWETQVGSVVEYKGNPTKQY